ncbi:MAG: hypothetical protein O2966_07580 [Proteobacteria bacterium]|nr:hypothetical protein [Pseudomonadota bacterium]
MQRKLFILCLLILSSFSQLSQAEPVALKTFAPGSYQQLLDSNANKPFGDLVDYLLFLLERYGITEQHAQSQSELQYGHVGDR